MFTCLAVVWTRWKWLLKALCLYFQMSGSGLDTVEVAIDDSTMSMSMGADSDAAAEAAVAKAKEAAKAERREERRKRREKAMEEGDSVSFGKSWTR